CVPSEDGDGLEVIYSRGQSTLPPQVLDEAWRTGQAAFGDGWAVLPLLSEARPAALLGVTLDELQELAPDERGFLLALAEVGAQAMDRARLFESEIRARAEAEAAVSAQDEFLSIASHELRTPVAAVKATAQLAQRAIQRGHYDPLRTTAYLEGIARAADPLASLVDRLLRNSPLPTRP